MASWDVPTVAAPSAANYAAPLVNWDELGKLPETYYKTKEMARQDAVANAFRGGIPRIDPNNPNSPPDYSAMSERMLQLGNYPEETTLQNTGLEIQRMRNGQRIADQYFSPAGTAPSGQPTPAQPSQPVNPQRSAPAGTPPHAPSATPFSVAAGNFPNDVAQAVAESLARQLGVGPNDPIDTKDPRVAGILGPAIGELKRRGVGQVVQQDGQPAAQPTPAPRVSQGFSDATGVPAHGMPDGTRGGPAPDQIADTAQSLGIASRAAAVQSRLDAMSPAARKAQLENWATNPALPKSLNEFAEKRLEAIERGEEPTNEMKNFDYDQRTGGGLTAREANIAGAKAGAEAPYKIAETAVREGGRPIPIKPNEVITTGSQVDPTLNGITQWAAKRMGLPAGTPASPPLPPQGSPRPAPTPPLPGTPAASNPGQPVRSAFTPQMVRNPDGSVASNITPSTQKIQDAAAEDYGNAHEAYNASQPVQMQLSTLENAFRNLNSSNWSKQGTGANAPAEIGRPSIRSGKRSAFKMLTCHLIRKKSDRGKPRRKNRRAWAFL